MTHDPGKSLSRGMSVDMSAHALLRRLTLCSELSKACRELESLCLLSRTSIASGSQASQTLSHPTVTGSSNHWLQCEETS
jgi:hypothetical protein